jgi:hypothetical protein
MQRVIIACLLLTAGLTPYTHAQETSNFNGLSVITGNIYPSDKHMGITIQNELIHMRGLDTSSLYDILYDMRNTGDQYGVVNITQPMTLYFNEFRPGYRSPLLDQMGKLFVDIFQVSDPATDIRRQIQDNFGQRLFIRRYVSSENLKTLGIYADIFKNNTRLNYTKVLVEFRWVDEDPYNLEKNTEVLRMQVTMSTDIEFKPNESFKLLSFIKVPTTICGIDQLQLYTPYQLNFSQSWATPLQKLYVQHDIFDITPIIPSSASYKTQYSGERSQVLTISNLPKDQKSGLAFYAIRENLQECGNTLLREEKSIIPAPITDVTASSWVKKPFRLENRNYVVTYETTLSDSIQEYQTGNPTNLDLFSRGVQKRLYSSYLMNDFIAGNCKSQNPGISVKEGGHPIFAFDISNYSEEDSAFAGQPNLARQTCWCEGADGAGEEEYIEFTLTQPSNAVSIFNGNWQSDSIFSSSTMTDVIRFSSPDGLIEDRKYSIIDLKIKNLYPISMPAGKYRIYLNDVENSKKNKVTCINSILFDFVLEDEWYQDARTSLDNAYNRSR